MMNRMNKKLVIKYVKSTFDEQNKMVSKKKHTCLKMKKCKVLLQILQKLKNHNFGFDKMITIADNGYKWLVVLPKEDNYAITMYVDKNNVPLLWYIDLIDSTVLRLTVFPFIMIYFQI